MNKTNKYEKLLADCKQFLSTRYDLLRLELLDKLSQIFGLFVLLLVALFLSFGALAYLSVALVGLMAQCMSVSLACTILAAILLLIVLILYLLRERMFINPFVKRLSNILYKESAEEEELVQDLEQRKEEQDDQDE